MAQKKPGGFVLYFDHVKLSRFLSREERGDLLLLLAEYAESGVVPDDLTGSLALCFEMMKEAIDRNNQTYSETCEKNRAKANKRWGNASNATACNGMQMDATACQAIPDDTDNMPSNADDANLNRNLNRNLNGTESEGVKKRQARFTPPTVAEVRAYCRERGNSVDAQHFVDHYTTNGWRRGNTPIKDWRACVRTWERTQGSYTQTTTPTQRNGLHAIPTAEEYAAGVDPSGFGWA